MSHLLTDDAWKPVEIPPRLSKWFVANRVWPVTAYMLPKLGIAQVKGGAPYRVHVVKKDHYAFIRVLEESNTPIVLGELSRNGVRRALSEAAKHDISVFRQLLFGGKYPGPLAYLMAGGDYVHVGECFDAHPSAFIKRTIFTLKSADECCSICKEGFID